MKAAKQKLKPTQMVMGALAYTALLILLIFLSLKANPFSLFYLIGFALGSLEILSTLIYVIFVKNIISPRLRKTIYSYSIQLIVLPFLTMLIFTWFISKDELSLLIETLAYVTAMTVLGAIFSSLTFLISILKKSTKGSIVLTSIMAIILGGGLLITINCLAPRRAGNPRTQLLKNVDRPTLTAETLTFDHLFSLKIDKTYLIDSPIDTSAKDYIQYRDNPKKYGSITHIFTYFPNEQTMTRYFQPKGPATYKLSYPLTDEAKKYNERYLYFDNDTENGVSTGMFYDKQVKQLVHGYPAYTIQSYYNSTSANNYNPLYKQGSSLGNSYCIIDLGKIMTEPSLTGYLVIHPITSAGGENNFCDELNKLSIFKIIKLRGKKR